MEVEAMETLRNSALEIVENQTRDLLERICMKIQRCEDEVRAGNADAEARLAELKESYTDLAASLVWLVLRSRRSDTDLNERIQERFDEFGAAGVDILPILARVDNVFPRSSVPSVILHIIETETPEVSWAEELLAKLTRVWAEQLASLWSGGLRGSFTTLKKVLKTAPIDDRMLALELLDALVGQDCMPRLVPCVRTLVPSIAKMLETVVAYGVEDEDGRIQVLNGLLKRDRALWEDYFEDEDVLDVSINKTACLLAKVPGGIAHDCLSTCFDRIISSGTSHDFLLPLFWEVCAAGHCLGPDMAAEITEHIREEEEGGDCPDCISEWKHDLKATMAEWHLDQEEGETDEGEDHEMEEEDDDDQEGGGEDDEMDEGEDGEED